MFGFQWDWISKLWWGFELGSPSPDPDDIPLCYCDSIVGKTSYSKKYLLTRNFQQLRPSKNIKIFKLKTLKVVVVMF